MSEANETAGTCEARIPYGNALLLTPSTDRTSEPLAAPDGTTARSSEGDHVGYERKKV
jgi:hypothetical protein